MYPVQLQTQRLVLREFSQDDVDAAHQLVGDDQVTEWLSFPSRSREEAASMVHGITQRATAVPRTEYYLAISWNEHLDDLIGFIRLGLDGVQAGKLGYALIPSVWQQGVATEACREMLRFAFNDLQLHRVSAALGPSNIASEQVVKKLGMRYEGTIRDHVYTNGQWRDSKLYSVLQPEWAAQSNHLKQAV